MDIFNRDYKELYIDFQDSKFSRKYIWKLIKAAWLLHRTRRESRIVLNIARAAVKRDIILAAKQLWDLYAIIHNNPMKEPALEMYDVDKVRIPIAYTGGKPLEPPVRRSYSYKPRRIKS
jgi:hypothetical protein